MVKKKRKAEESEITQLKKKCYHDLELSTTRASVREIGLRWNHISKAREKPVFNRSWFEVLSLLVCVPGAGASRRSASARRAGMLVRLWHRRRGVLRIPGLQGLARQGAGESSRQRASESALGDARRDRGTQGRAFQIAWPARIDDADKQEGGDAYQGGGPSEATRWTPGKFRRYKNK